MPAGLPVEFLKSEWQSFAGQPEALLRVERIPDPSSNPVHDAEVLRKWVRGLDLAALSPEQQAKWKGWQGEAEVISSRAREWLVARTLEIELRKACGREALLSFSHTRSPSGHWVIAVAALAGGIQAVGVDLEWGERAVSDQTAKRLMHPLEMQSLEFAGMSPLDFWVLKEAAFKATPENHGAVVMDFRIEDWHSAKSEGQAESEVLRRQGLGCRVKLLSAAGWKVAFAYTFQRLK